MTLDDVDAALRASLQGAPPNQTIELVGAAAREPALAGLAPLLRQLRLGATWTLGGAAVARQREQVLLTGSGGYALPGATEPPVAVDVTLSATAPSTTTVAFELALAIATPGWTLERSLATPQAPLPPTLLADLDDDALRWQRRSAIADAEVDAATITARSGADALELSGWLTRRGPLAGYAEWVGPWPLRLSGALAIGATPVDPSAFELRAIAPDGELRLGPLTLNEVGFGLRSLTGLDPELAQRTGFSELDLLGTVRLGDALSVRLRAPLLVSPAIWHLLADIEHGPPLSGGLAWIADWFDLPPGTLSIPPGLSGFDQFRLSEVEAVLERAEGAVLPTGVRALAVTIEAPEPWKPPIPGLHLIDVGTRWLLSWTQIRGVTTPIVSGSVFGSIAFGDAVDAPTLDLVATLPHFVLSGALRDDTPIRVDEVLRKLLGPDGPSAGRLEVTGLSMLADPSGQTYGAAADITTDWPLPFLTGLSLTNLSLRISVTQSQVSGGIEGLLTLTSAVGRPALRLSAEYQPRGGGGWIFRGGLVPGAPPTIADLVALIAGTAPDALRALSVARLEATVDTGRSTWSFAGALAARFDLTLLDVPVRIGAGAEVAVAKDGSGVTSARLVAGFTINRLAVRVAADVGVPDPTYALRVRFDRVWLLATVGWRSAHDSVAKHRVVVLQLGGFSLGDLLEQLVRLAAPTLDLRIEAPWDVLKRIDLARFTLTIDPTERLIEMRYRVEADLVLLYVETVGVRYRLDGENRVELILDGRLMGKEFRGPDALRWDVVRDPPPPVPGTGPALLELRYLALGQRIRLADPQPRTVADAIGRLRSDMEPRAGTDVDPLAGGKMDFDAGGGWLAALDLTALGTLDLALVFSDGNVYGLSVGLHGERAGSLAGLRFEILYKRLGAGIGMFRAELALPEAFRHIELGEVSVTLGVIAVEVYTNGNFLVDLGFPHERDFERSFSLEAFPFLGRGGIYFGLLNGTTSRSVPAIVSGTFSPVLELGVGLAAGVGKDVSIGPLSGGIYVQVEVIFQGVLAWFQPAGGAGSARYHWAQGVAAIHGKLYGEVDFKVVKASVALEAYAQASVTFEAHRATVFALEVSVEAEAEVEVLWISVSFSFDVSFDASFTVGSDTAAPWTLAPPPARRLGAGEAAPIARAPRRLVAAQRRAAQRALADGGGSLLELWRADRNVFDGARATVAASLLPVFTLAGPPIDWTVPPGEGEPAAPADSAPAWRVAFALFAGDGSAPGARTARAAVAPEDPAGDPPAVAPLVEGLLRRALATVSGGEAGKVTAGQLALLAEQLADPALTDAAFGRDALKAFFQANLVLEVTGDVAASPAGAMALPVPPFLTISATPGGTRDLTRWNPVGPAYSRGAAAYMADFSPVTAAPDETQPDDPARYTSFSAHVFCDWCLMVTREAVQRATATLARRSVPAQAGSLDALAADATLFPRDAIAYIVRAGDTLASVAVALGATVAELRGLNPRLADQLAVAAAGDVLTVTVGVTGATLAEQNADVTLAASAVVAVRDVRVQVRAGDSLDAISARLYGAPDAARLVADARLGDKRVLLRGATVPVPARSGPLPGLTDADLVAGILYVRYFADLGAPLADWYAQAIADLNATALSALRPDEPLPAGMPLTVPAAPMGSTTTTYATVTGDSLAQIGAALSLAQSPGAYADRRWVAFHAEVRVAGGVVQVPARAVELGGGETLDLLGARLVAPAATLLGWLAAAPLLTPLAVLTLATLSLGATQQPTLAAMAATVGLTVAELTARPEVTGATGLFAVGTPLVLAQLPAQAVDTLVAETCSGARLTDLAHQVSRNLLSGVRLPLPQAGRDGHALATGPLTALAELTGQQLPAPPLDAGATLAVTVTKTDPADPELGWLVLDPGPSAGTITYGYDESALRDRYPASRLAVTPRAPGPRALPVAGEVPRTYGLDHRVTLQAAAPLPIPGAVATAGGGPTLWPFPAAVRAKARAGSATPFELLRAPHGVGDVARHDPVPASTFALHVPLTLRRLPGAERLYELLDADVADRDLLLALARSARSDPVDPGRPRTRVLLAVAPPPGAADPNGLAVLAADPAATFAVRTDMATDAPRAAPPDVLSAPLSDAAGFLALLWQGSGTQPGTCLAFATTQGDDLPPGSVADDGTVVLWAIGIAREQQAGAPSGRRLLVTDTCALVGPGLDALAGSLYLEAHDPQAHPQELVRQAIVPPGTAGVTLTIPRAPSPAAVVAAGGGEGDDDAEQARLAQRFSLLATRLTGTYEPPRAGPPQPPQREDGLGLPLWRRRRLARAERLAGTAPADPPPVEWWRYEQVVPAASFGPPSVAPAVPGLPVPADDPYRGFGSARALAQATFQLGFADLLGNVTAEPFDRAVQATMGYTDPLLGVRAWPATTATWGVARSAGDVTLTVAIAAQPAAVVPAPGAAPAAAAGAAARQAARLAEAYFQLAQPTVSATLLTPLVPGGDGAPLPQPTREGTAPLWRYLAGATLYAQAAAALAPAPLDGLTTLADVVAAHGVSAAALAAVNAGLPASALLRAGQSLGATATAAVELGDSAATIVARIPPGWPAPTAAELLAASANANGPALRPGAVVTIPPLPVTIGPDAPRLSLAAVAAANHTTPARLAIDAASAPVLQDGFRFAFDGRTVTAGGQVRSFDAVRAAFEQLGVQVAIGELADAAATGAGIFAVDARLTLAHAVAGEASTLAALAGTQLAGAAAANADARDLYPPGTTLSLGAWTPAPVVPSGGATLGELAARLGTTAAALLGANPTLALAAQSRLVVPGAVVLPAAGVRVPYAVAPGDTLDLIVPCFATDAATLAGANRALPGTLAPGRPVAVTVGGQRYETTTTAQDSFETVWERLHAQQAAIAFGDLVAAIASDPQALAAGALLVCPAAALAPKGPPPGPPPSALTAAQVAAAYDVDALAFAQANAALVGVLAAGVTLAAPAPSRATEQTVARDTLNAVLARFQAHGVAVDLAGLLAANPAVALYRAGARALLPPPPASVSADLGIVAGPFAAPAFPLTATLRLQRDAAVVDPALATPGHDGPVERAEAAIPPPSAPADGGGRTLDAFVDQCLQALPSLRLATAKVRGKAADLWAVDFGAGGIASVALTGGVTYPRRPGSAPRTLALRPLYRTPQSRTGVPVPTLTAGGALGPAAPASFDGVDVETWARRLLADLDLFLSPAYVAGMYATATARSDLAALLRLRWRLARAIAAGLAPVSEGDDPQLEAGRVQAAEQLARACGASLAAAYDTALAVQYDTTARSPYPDPPAATARLQGGVRTAPASGPAPSFTSAPAGLGPAPGFATFLVAVADPAEQRVVDPGALHWVPDALALDVHAVPDGDGALAAQWLTFVRPLTGAYATPAVAGALGAPPLPIPLRAQPAPPLIVAQDAQPTHAGPRPPLNEAGTWTFALTYAHEHAAQDELLLRATFNVPGAPAPGELEVGSDLAAALWPYAALADALRERMVAYTDAPAPAAADGSPGDPRDHLAHSLVELVDPIATAWEAHWAQPVRDDADDDADDDGEPYAFRVRVEWQSGTADEPLLAAVVLALESPVASPSPTGAWPAVAWRTRAGVLIELVPDASGPQGGRLRYTPRAPIARDGTPTLRIAWGGLPIATTQNGRASLSVHRNEHLVEDVATNEAFVMATATVSAPDVATPLLTWSQELTMEGADLGAALAAALSDLFGAATGPPVTLELAYGHRLVAPDPDADSRGIHSWMAVALAPQQPLSPAVAPAVAAAAASWQRSWQPSPDGATWALMLTLSSNLPRRTSRPLLTIDRLVYVPSP